MLTSHTMCEDFDETNLIFKVDGPLKKLRVCPIQSRERKHDLRCRGNRLLYTRDDLVVPSLETENIQKCNMSCNIGIQYELDVY